MDHDESELPIASSSPFLGDAVDQDLSDHHNSIFFAAVSTTRMPMIVSDPNLPDNPIVFANPAFVQMTGYSREEMYGRNCRFLQGPDTDRDVVAEVSAAIAREQEVSVEILNYKKNGASFWNALFISPVYDAKGKLVYFFASQLDVSRRRDAEDSLRQAQKMEAVGQLTGGVAHDFNNLLTVITGFTDMLIAQLKREESFDFTKARRSAQAVMQAAERGSALTQQLLAFARKQKLSDRVVDVNELVNRLRPLIERTAGGSVDIITKLHDEPCNARLDAVQAELALINILINARDAMPDGGTITVETGLRTIDREDEGFATVDPGRYVSLTVTDSGSGMPADILARITEPFFTTKEQGKGTGLGLSMVFGFVKQSGGALRIYSEVGHGTTVRMYFRCDERKDGNADPRPTPARIVHGGDETILVVEDQIDVGDYGQAVLEEFGYTVIRADNGPDAIEILEGETPIDLLFTDLIMPGGMNGVVLAREAKKRRPKIKVLLTTGFAESSIERVDARGNEFDLVNKPYRRSDLIAKVRQVIEGPNGVA